MKRLAFLTAAVFLAVTATAQTREAFGVKETTLPNGLTVWINEDHTQPKVIGAVVVKAGAKDCPDTGIAHYFEHILFKGTDKIGTVDYAAEKPWLDSIAAKYDLLARTKDGLLRAEIQKDINRLSRKAGEYAIPNEFNNLITKFGGTGLNAFTSFDETVFLNTFTPQYVAQWAELNSERLINPVFRLFQGELETVYEEKNMYSDNMLAGALEAVQARAFAGTPYAYPVIGSTESLKNPRLSEMKAFYDKYYVAGNMGLILCGDIEADSVLPVLEKTFGRIRAGSAPQAAPLVPKPFRPGERLNVKVPVPVIKAGGYLFRAPTDRDADNEAFNLAVSLLSNDAETGLLDSLANEYRVLLAVAGKIDAFKELGLAGIGYVPNLPFGSKKKAGKRCLEQVEKIKSGDFGEPALEALKTEKLMQAERSLEDLERRAYMMVNAFSHNVPWEEVLRKREKIKAATKADVMAAARKYFNEERLQLAKKFGKYPKEKVEQPGYVPVTPKHSGARSDYAKALERMPVAETKPKLVDFGKDAATVRLGELATLYAVENPMNDIFELQLIYHKGTLADPRLSAVADYIPTIGTDSLSKHDFGKALQAIGASIDIEAGNKTFTITLSGFDSKLEPALRLLRRLLERAKPDKKMFRNLVSAEKIGEKAFFRESGNIVQAVGEMVAYGQASSYLNRLTPSALKGLGGDGLVALFKQVQENELSIVYSGRLGAEEVEAAVRRHLPVAKATRPRTDSYRPLQACAEPVVYVFDNPEARQTVVGSYLRLPATPAWQERVRLQLWGEYFGGGMSSLLFQDIREFRSLAYYAYGQTAASSMATRPDAPTGYLALLGTQADKTMAALGVLDSLFRQMPMRESGIAAAKRDLLNSVNNDRPTFRGMGRTIALWRANGYDTDPRRPLTELLPAMGMRDVESYYEENVKHAPRAVFIVGDKKKLDRQQLEKYGKVVVLEREDFYKK